MSVTMKVTLRSLREEAGLSVMELAYQARLSVPTIYRMENGTNGVTRITAQKVLNVLSKALDRKIALDSLEIKLIER